MVKSQSNGLPDSPPRRHYEDGELGHGAEASGKAGPAFVASMEDKECQIA